MRLLISGIYLFLCWTDEFLRYYMLRENVSNILTMVQPSVDAYSLDQYVARVD